MLNTDWILRGMPKVRIHGLSGECLAECSVERATTFLQVKHSISEAAGVPTHDQRLLYNSILLSDHQCISDVLVI